MEELLRTIGQRVQEERKAAGLTQESLAEIANLSVSYVGQIERGLREPSLKALMKVASALGVELFSLFVPTNVDEALASRLDAMVRDLPAAKRAAFVDALAKLAPLIE